jgi:bis(5'-adenosyl)-triphosphatase
MNTLCPFCSNQIARQMFLEYGNMLAIYNIAPILPGHSLIIPKKHIESIKDFTEDELLTFFKFARKATQLLCKAFGSDGYDWSLQESEAAGQSIAHLHLHVIPRKHNDLNNPGDWYPLLEQNRQQVLDSSKRKPLSGKEIDSVIRHIKNCLQGDGTN